MITAIILLLLGLGFVLAEVFFPSLGILAVLAAGCFLLADIMAFDHSQIAGWTFIVSEVILIPVVVRFAFQLLPKLSFGKRMLLAQPTDVGAGLPDLTSLLGRAGVAETLLQPSGRGVFGDDRHSVIARGLPIEAGCPIIVVAVEGSEIQVRAVEESTGSAP